MHYPAVRIEFDERKVDALVQELNECHHPGASLGISIDGEPLYRKSFGLANIQLPIRLSSTIRMRIGSISKHFTCLAYMLLCEDGLADIDDPVGKYLPELHPVASKVTMRQLMGHLSGLRDCLDIGWYLSGMEHNASSADLLSLYRTIDDVNNSPGTAWNYNNGGFLILSVAIERIADSPLEQVLHERIFAPLNMQDTLLSRRETDFIPNGASAHMLKPGGGYQKRYLGGAIAGEGGMLSSVDDMLRWLGHMNSPSIGSVATWEAMKTPQRLANGCSTGYGLGLRVGQYRGVETIHHSGNVGGWNSQMLKVPGAGLDIVILANSEGIDPSLLTTRILDECVHNLRPVEAVSRALQPGVFRSHETGRVIQLSHRSGKQIVSINGENLVFAAQRDGIWRPESSLMKWKWAFTLSGDKEMPAFIQFDDFGNTDVLRQEAPANVSTPRLIGGRYRSETTDTDAKIASADETLTLTTTGRFGSAAYSLEQLTEHVWRAKLPDYDYFGGVLSFDQRQNFFSFSTVRTRGLGFRRDA